MMCMNKFSLTLLLTQGPEPNLYLELGTKLKAAKQLAILTNPITGQIKHVAVAICIIH